MARKPKQPPTHQQLLEAELDLDKIALIQKTWQRPVGFLSELEHAIRPHIHEGHLPNYGAIVSDCDSELPGWTRTPMAETDVAIGRSLADGIRSFALFVDGKFVGLVSSDLRGVDEASLVNLVQDKLCRGAIITADARGVVRIVYPHGVAVHMSRRWREKPMVDAVISRIYSFAPMAGISKLREILSFAYHTLSPRHIGATLVWCLQPPTPNEVDAMKAPINLSALQLNVGVDAHRSMLRHLLAQTDGATIIQSDGKVTGTGAHLKTSSQSLNFIASSKGTRHTSAQRFSFDCASALVITVSADGPVTIYSDGVSVAELKFVSADKEARGLAEMVPDKKHDIIPSTWEETCPKCGKTSVIEEVVIYGWKDREEANCPVCGTEIASTMCFTISAHIIKRLPAIRVLPEASVATDARP